MGFRYDKSYLYLFCSYSDGFINIYFRDELIDTFEIGIKGIEFSKQCIFTETRLNNVKCYMSNDKYIFILRFDGTYNLIDKNNKKILISNRVKDKNILFTSTFVSYGGGYYDSKSIHPLNLQRVKNNYVLSSARRPYVNIFLNSSNNEHLDIIKSLTKINNHSTTIFKNSSNRIFVSNSELEEYELKDCVVNIGYGVG